MARSTEAFPSKFLKSADMKTKPIVATISRVVQEVVGQDKELKWVIHFEDEVKPMVCNRTNFETIEADFGDSDNWPSHKVKIFCAPTSFQGRRTEGIRVQTIVPKPALKDDLKDEVAV
jgi:hypothetical protein